MIVNSLRDKKRQGYTVQIHNSYIKLVGGKNE